MRLRLTILQRELIFTNNLRRDHFGEVLHYIHMLDGGLEHLQELLGRGKVEDPHTFGLILVELFPKNSCMDTACSGVLGSEQHRWSGGGDLLCLAFVLYSVRISARSISQCGTAWAYSCDRKAETAQLTA